MIAIQQAQNGKWWVDMNGDSSFDPALINAARGGVWFYNGYPRPSVFGPFDSQEKARQVVELETTAMGN